MKSIVTWGRAALVGHVALLAGCADLSNQDFEELGQAEQALSAVDVFGFEDISLWTVSSGAKHALPTATQGATALGVSSFYYTQITSAVIDNVGVVSSELALDVKLPAASSWGDIRVIVRAPSVGVWYGDLGAISLATLGSGSFQTAVFQVPGAIQTALQSSPSDVTFEIVVNGPSSPTPTAFDNLRFVTPNTGPSVVEIRAPLVDDLAYLVVNGVRHRVGYWGQDGNEAQNFRDVTDWFVGGVNDVRLHAINYGGPQGIQFELRVDGVLVSNIACSDPACPLVESSVYLDQAITLPSLNLPAARQVTVTSPVPGKLYLDDEFTGLTTPATLSLPAGEYRLGLGVSNDNPNDLTGSFHEESVTVGGGDVSVVIGDEPALGVQYETRIAVLPIRRARVTSTGRVAVLSDEQAEKFGGQVVATGEDWVVPYSYGLNAWDVTVLPIEEDLELVAPTPDDFPNRGCELLNHPKYSNLLDQYDTVMVHVEIRDETLGTEIGGGAATMGGRCGQIHAGSSFAHPATEPQPVILHELLHSYEAHQTGVLYHFNGVEGLHGAEEHGYNSDGPEGWNEWYRYFMRGQAPEVTSMRPGVHIPVPVLTPAYYTGVFRSVRHGTWLAP